MTDTTVDESLPILAGPADSLRPVVDDPAALGECIAALRDGTGPISIDTERAQTFRYSAKAYLIQVRREGAGTWLVDPASLENGSPRADLAELTAALDDVWVLHAASQDLPCLTEVGMIPSELFDTELAGRLLGLPRVGLGALVEEALGVRLLKEYSAVDWSSRPLPAEWLVYAALDVELLGDLKQWLTTRLEAAGKDEWARQEFAHVLTTYTAPPVPRTDPWRRTSGIHHLRSERALAVVAELWATRDILARSMDKAPSRLLPDRVVVEIAGLAKPGVQKIGRADVLSLPGMRRRQYQRHLPNWLDAVGRAMSLPRADLPPRSLPQDGPPPVRSWEARNPEAAARWDTARPAVVALAADLSLPVENLITPDTLRRVLWNDPPGDGDWADALRTLGARPWQTSLVAPVLTAAAGDHA
ncbi:HRDC domain-containing protein [Propionicicella superfundia]|uniref:HRDC domain-containing protein n=1 Tax=Propionicicella superfundia TaxID=348582 RepID=UPI00041E61D2|nr:HRDC domain-containing protein [Propionicicella superfundia]